MKKKVPKEEISNKIKNLFPEGYVITMSSESMNEIITLLMDSVEIHEIVEEEDVDNTWIDEAAVRDWLEIGKTQLYYWRQSKVIEYSQPGKKLIMYNKGSILRYLETKAIDPDGYDKDEGNTTWISNKAAKEILKIGTTQLFYWRKAKRIRYTQPGHKIIRYDKEYLLEFLKKNVK